MEANKKEFDAVERSKQIAGLLDIQVKMQKDLRLYFLISQNKLLLLASNIFHRKFQSIHLPLELLDPLC